MITTSDFAVPGSYYGETSNNSRFVIEVRRNKGITFYIEEKDYNITKSKSFTDKELRWKYEEADSETEPVYYKSQNLSLDVADLKFKYNVKNCNFEIILSKDRGITSKAYTSYLKDINNLYPPVSNKFLSSKGVNKSDDRKTNIFNIILFIFAAILALGLASLSVYKAKKYLF